MGNLLLIPKADNTIASHISDTKSLERFRFWHVEPLLNQAADLLNRCLKDQSEYNSLRAQASLLQWDIDRLDAEQSIDESKLNQGWLDVEPNILQLEIGGREGTRGEHQQVINHFVSWQRSNPDSTELHGAYFNSGGQVQQAIIAQKRLELEIAVKNEQKKWAEQDRNFRLKSITDKRKFIGQKQALMVEGGPLDYRGQCTRIGKRIERDFTDAYDRLRIAAEGLELLYGCPKSLIQLLPINQKKDEDAFLSIDGCVQWARDAIRWLVAFSQLDQEFTLIVSLKQSVGQIEWDRSITSAAKQGQLHLRFIVPTNKLDNHTYVRLRGMSAFIEGPNSKDDTWSGIISLPKDAFSYHLDDMGSKIIKDVSQIDLPRCYLGRIESRTSPRSPEINGLVSLMNASPLGKDGSQYGEWDIFLDAPISRGKSYFKDLSDVEVELHLVGRPN
jgi:hypothetical protein